VTAKRTSTGIAQLVRALCAQGCADQSDGQLLSQFLSRRDEAAFVALVRRHGPMVLGVCRRLLGNADDAEDAFQATFLVLVRKAASLTARPVLGDWLHGVARRTALNARRAGARRRAKEQAMARPGTQGEAIPDDWLPLLDEELGRLPEHYRLPIVLCDLEGKTRREAAERLGWPEGTVAGRLARGRALLARRLARHGGAASSSCLAAVLAPSAASACVSEALVYSTARAASLLALGPGAATAVISARVAALTEGVVRAMFLTKLKSVTCALALTVLVGLGGVALAPGSGPLPAAGAAAPQKGGEAKPDAEAQKLVGQLGSPSYAKRQAAQKALTSMGARAAGAVRAGMGDADPEVAKRCATIWPRLWQTELARPDNNRLAGYTHPLWDRFRTAAGDDAGSRTLFAEMVADFKRFRQLEAVEADPEKAVAAYAAELKQRGEALARGYREAQEAESRNPKVLTGFMVIAPKSGYPTRGESVTLLFLGTYPATAKNESGVVLYSATPAALRRLFATWLGTRTAPGPIEGGLIQAVNLNVPEVFPVALAHAANDKLAPRARGFALLAVGCFGTPADLPVLEKAFADSRVYHTTDAGSDDGKRRPVEVQVSDAAVVAALRLAGKDPADFGFTFLERYKVRGPQVLQLAAVSVYGVIGFFDDAARQAAHQKARAWLDKHRKEKPRQQP
jgi:RNA polymerase sigma factor (sigma-70 family)